MGDELNAGRIFFGTAVNGDENPAGVGNDVGVGKDPIFTDQEATADTAAEMTAAADQATRARLVCDFLSGMTDGYAARTYKRLFSPDFGSISDLVG